MAELIPSMSRTCWFARDAGPVPDDVCDAAPTATLTVDNLVADTNTNIIVFGDIPIGSNQWRGRRGNA